VVETGGVGGNWDACVAASVTCPRRRISFGIDSIGLSEGLPLSAENFVSLFWGFWKSYWFGRCCWWRWMVQCVTVGTFDMYLFFVVL
jgi:hypothetical protein